MTGQQAATKALRWVLEDFREAENLYQDYQAVEGFSDEEYDEMLKTLRHLADQPEA